MSELVIRVSESGSGSIHFEPGLMPAEQVGYVMGAALRNVERTIDLAAEAFAANGKQIREFLQGVHDGYSGSKEDVSRRSERVVTREYPEVEHDLG